LATGARSDYSVTAGSGQPQPSSPQEHHFRGVSAIGGPDCHCEPPRRLLATRRAWQSRRASPAETPTVAAAQRAVHRARPSCPAGSGADQWEAPPAGRPRIIARVCTR